MRLSGERMFQAEGAGSSKDPEVGICQIGVCQACCTSCSCKVARIAGRGGSLWWTAPYLPTSWLPASQILSCQTFLFLKSNWLEMSDKQNGIYHTINSWHIIFIYYLFYFRGLSPSSHIIYFPSHSICSQPKILNICTFNPTSLFLFVYVCVRIFKKILLFGYV